MTRWLVHGCLGACLVACALAACGKKADRDPPAAGSGSAVVEPARPRGRALPPAARCSGRWAGTLAYTDRKECADAILAPLGAFDLTITAGAKQWESSLRKPDKAQVMKLDVQWHADEAHSEGDGCTAKVTIGIGDEELDLELSNGMVDGTAGKARARATVVHHGTGACTASGPGTVQLVADTGRVPDRT